MVVISSDRGLDGRMSGRGRPALQRSSSDSSLQSFSLSKSDQRRHVTMFVIQGASLYFGGLGVENASRKIAIQNGSQKDFVMIFRVECNNPKGFRLEPAFGTIAPGKKALVTVTKLRSWESNVYRGSRENDRFVVRTAFVRPEWKLSLRKEDLPSLWKTLDNDPSTYGVIQSSISAIHSPSIAPGLPEKTPDGDASGPLLHSCGMAQSVVRQACKGGVLLQVDA